MLDYVKTLEITDQHIKAYCRYPRREPDPGKKQRRNRRRNTSTMIVNALGYALGCLKRPKILRLKSICYRLAQPPRQIAAQSNQLYSNEDNGKYSLLCL
jgi:hypothetical protein